MLTFTVKPLLLLLLPFLFLFCFVFKNFLKSSHISDISLILQLSGNIRHQVIPKTTDLKKLKKKKVYSYLQKSKQRFVCVSRYRVKEEEEGILLFAESKTKI